MEAAHRTQSSCTVALPVKSWKVSRGPCGAFTWVRVSCSAGECLVGVAAGFAVEVAGQHDGRSAGRLATRLPISSAPLTRRGSSSSR